MQTTLATPNTTSHATSRTRAPAKSRSAAFWNRIAPKYARKPVKDAAAYEAKLSLVRALLKRDDQVLEIGCGTGSTALALAPGVARYTATDVSERMIDIADQKRKQAGLENLVVSAAPATAQTPGAPYDAVMGFSLLHLVDDLPETLCAVHSQLRPGGLFLSKTPCLGDAGLGVRLLIKAIVFIGYAPPILLFTQKELRHALTDAGFEIEALRHFGKDGNTPFFMARRPVRRVEGRGDACRTAQG
ncbi:MAG: class I SAM-dependent methyltransferase [Pseudomonadota bacterium]